MWAHDGKGKGKGKVMGPPEPPPNDWWNQDPRGQGGPPQQPVRAPGVEEPRVVTYRSLGHLKNLGHEGFRFFEHMFLQWVLEILTVRWGRIQGGSDMRSLSIWAEIFMTLELDRKAAVDLMLLAHQGIAGRCEANEILWELLSVWALKPEYEDLSHKVSNMVFWARRNLDRPPATNYDRGSWRWQRYYEPRHPQWDPRAVPSSYVVLKGPGGVPLPPPDCWGPAPQ